MNQSLSKKILECREKIIRNMSILGLIEPVTVEIPDPTFSFWSGNTIRVSPNDQYHILNESDCRRIISDLNYALRNRSVVNSLRDKTVIKLLLEIGRICFYLILDHAGMTEIPDLWCEEETAELDLATGKAHDFIEILCYLYDQFNLQNESAVARAAIENTYCVLSLAKAYEIVRLWDRMDAQIRNLLQSYLKDMESHITNDIPLPSVDLWTIGSLTNSYEEMLEKRKETILETLRELIKESEDEKERSDKVNCDDVSIEDCMNELVDDILEIPYVRECYSDISALKIFLLDENYLKDFISRLYYYLSPNEGPSEKNDDCFEVLEYCGILLLLHRIQACGQTSVSKGFWKKYVTSKAFIHLENMVNKIFMNTHTNQEITIHSRQKGLSALFDVLAETCCDIPLKVVNELHKSFDEDLIMDFITKMEFKENCTDEYQYDPITGRPIGVDVVASISQFFVFMNENVRQSRRQIYDDAIRQSSDGATLMNPTQEKRYHMFECEWHDNIDWVHHFTRAGTDMDGNHVDKDVETQFKKEDKNMENVTKNMFDGMMQKVTGVAMTMNGEIAVKSGDSYKTYDQKKGCLVNVTGLTLPGSDGMFFTIPSTKVNVGDLIFINAEKPVFVTEVSNKPKRITVVNYATNEVSTIVPETYLFMGSTYFFKKIVCPFGNMFGKGNKGMMKMLMFQSMFNNQNQDGLIPISSSGPNMMNLGSLMIMKSCFGNDSNFDFLDFDDTGIDFSEDTKADIADDQEDKQLG